MIYITKRRNKNKEPDDELYLSFRKQFSDERKLMMSGHISFRRDLEKFAYELVESTGDSPSPCGVIKRAVSLILYLSDDALDNLTELYAAEAEDASPTLASGDNLFTAGYRNSLDYYRETVASILKRSTFKGTEKDEAAFFYRRLETKLQETLDSITDEKEEELPSSFNS